jgi:hypothetical protein
MMAMSLSLGELNLLALTLAQKLKLRSSWRRMMVVVGRFAIENSPSRCTYCGQPLKQHLYAWRSSSGKLYCSEFCADDEEETNFQEMRHHDERLQRFS